MDMLDFSALKPKTVQFRGPDGELYTARSATAGVCIEYRNEIALTAVYDAGKSQFPVKFGSSAKAEAILVAGCVFRSGAPAKGDPPVGLDHIKEWPPEVIDGLHELIYSISPGLKKGEKGDPLIDPKESKKDSGGSSS